MATYSRTVRRGLPRTPDGEPWPAAGEAPIDVADAPVDAVDPIGTEAPAAPRAEPPVVERAQRVETTAAPLATEGVSTRASGPRSTTGAGVAVRRGLPRVAGGEPWPPAGVVPVAAGAEITDAGVVDAHGAAAGGADAHGAAAGGVDAHGAAAGGADAQVAAAGGADGQGGDEAQTVEQGDTATAPVAAAGDVSTRSSALRSTSGAAAGTALRRGLPRTKGGEPWPPAGVAPAAGSAAEAPAAETSAAETSAAETPAAETPAETPAAKAPTAAQDSTPTPGARSAGGKAPRRGLPRPGAAAAGGPSSRTDAVGPGAGGSRAASAPAPAASAATPAETAALTPLPFSSSVHVGEAAARWEADRARTIGRRKPITPPEPTRHGPFTTGQWVGAVVVAVIVLIGAAGMLVLLTRWFLSLEFMQSFLTAYPGAYELPEQAPVGFPAWLNWQHFLNIFFIVLIIRSGLYVRHQKRPAAFWSPRGNPKRKISIQLWLHQSLDILWLVNGVVFIVLLLATGQWMRLVPTDWSVFPNALSAGLQYVSLDWPVEDGWVTYNSLQQLAYFAVVFLAAPLAAITGVRMSGVWPKNATALNKAYPIEWARAVHFPTMIFFVLFIIAHVTLVVTTGFLHNLNAMFAANPGHGWIGFWFFVGAIVITAAGWVAARPLILAPIAKLFGRVSER